MARGTGVVRSAIGNIAAVGLALIAVSVPAAAGQEATQQRNAQEIFGRMAKRLSGSTTLTVTAVREMDAELVRQTRMPERATIEIAVMRPSHLRARTVAPTDVRTFLADGQRVTVLDEKMNVYATTPVPGSIDAMTDKVEERFGFAPPIAALLSNDVERSVRAKARSMSYKGEETVDGERCETILLRGDDTDAELCVAKDDLPRRLVVTYKDTPGNPKMRVTFSDWQLGAQVDRGEFTFKPPRGAQEVEMVPVEKLEPPPTKSGGKEMKQQ